MKAIPFPAFRALQSGGTWLKSACPAILLGLLACWLYAPTGNFEFVNWDDPWYVTNNPLIKSWSLENLKGIATETVTRNYAPGTIFSFLVDYTLWGDWAGGYHLTSLALHAINGVLVFFLLRQVTGQTVLAFATAALFVVHPVQVESVAWVSSRKGLLSGAFVLGSLICWLREDRRPTHEVWGMGLLALALLCKAIAVVVPALVLCYDVFVRRQNRADAFVRQIIPGFLALWLLLTTMAAQVTQLGGVRGHFELSRFEILAVDLILLWRYVGMLLCPHNLCVLYDPPTEGFWPWALVAGVAWGFVGWRVWRNRERQPLVLFAALSALVLLLPVLNFFPITTLMNDRYLYLPSIPALALLVAAAGLLLNRFERLVGTKIRWAVGGALLLLVTVGFVARTQAQLPVWRNDLALWESAAQHVPQLPVVQIQRAISLHNAGRTDAALAALDYALIHCRPDELDRKRILEKQAAWRQ